MPPSHRGSPIATIEDLLDLRGGRIGRQVCELLSPDRGYAVRQSERVQPSMMEISEKCA